ncbi:MAG: hypothetical protein K0R63_1105 [Rickettsiales bacterium]|jgi:hypothetical protein|nr:hypothetical protein [Rickettsiales bacterium]
MKILCLSVICLFALTSAVFARDDSGGVTLSNYSEKLVYWDGFDMPTGMEIHFTINTTSKDDYTISFPVLIKYPLPKPQEFEGGLNRGRYALEYVPMTLTHEGYEELPPYLTSMVALDSVGWGKDYKVDEINGKINLSYVFYPEFMASYTKDHAKICLKHNRPIYIGKPYSIKAYENQFFIADSHPVTALWSYTKSSHTHSDFKNILAHADSVVQKTPIDVSEDLTQLLMEKSELNKQPELWRKMQNQFMPSTLLSKGYSDCTASVKRDFFETLCFCKS